MRRTIRINCFETNSSSLHSLVVASGNRHVPDYMTKELIKVTGGEFGWEWDVHRDPETKLNYLYTGLKSFIDSDDSEDVKKYSSILEKVKNALESVGIQVEWSQKEDGYYSNGYIDHVSRIRDFLGFIGESEDNILDFIFDDNSAISTGNDNEDTDNPQDITPEGVDYVEFYKGN